MRVCANPAKTLPTELPLHLRGGVSHITIREKQHHPNAQDRAGV